MPELDLPDATLAYKTAGALGPRVLLIQGVGSVGEGWRPQIEALRHDHQLVWFDNRGVGESSDSGEPLTRAPTASPSSIIWAGIGPISPDTRWAG